MPDITHRLSLTHFAKPMPKHQSLTTVKNFGHRVRFLAKFKLKTDKMSVLVKV